LVFVTGLALAVFTAATAYAAGPKAYIGLFKDNAVAVVDTASYRLLTTIPIPPGPHGLVAAPDGRTVYASSDGDSKVSVIDTATDTVRTTIEVGKSPHGLAITPDGGTVLAAVFGANAVVFIDTASNTVRGQVGVASPHNIALTPDGRTAYVASQSKGAFALVVLDVAGMKQTAIVPLEKMPRALNVSPDGKKLYYTLAGLDAVQVLATGDNMLSTQVPVGASPHHPLFAPGTQKALVVSQGPGVLSVIDWAKDQVAGTVKVGTLPHWIAVGPGSRFAYVTNEGSNDLTVVNLDSLSVVATVPVGNAPRKIVIVPGMGAALSAPAPASVTDITGFAFTDTLKIKAGQTVTWTNKDPVPHTVTSDTGLWDSGDIAAGASYSTKFTLPGAYAYHCNNHPAMTGTVVVSAM
jgi:YVTN family beta-propeller protein